MKSNFEFLRAEWPDLYGAASRAEALAYPDPRTACFYARRGLEVAVHWLYKHDASLRLPYQDNLSALVHEPTFRHAVDPAVFNKVKLIKDLGNLAVHSHKTIREADALAAVRELFHVAYAQSLIDNFSILAKPPHIAISVDMLDTGIDIPEVVNLVFFKLVRSKTKFWQMVGRGTRLCPDLFGPGKNKEFFFLFDYCQNLEFFSQNPETTDGTLNESLGKKLFVTRLELIAELDKKRKAVPVVREGEDSEEKLRHETAELLRVEVAAMNLDNFVVRPKRRLVEKYAKPEAWTEFSPEAMREVAHEVAGLPSEQEAEDEEAKRFDLLMLNLQLAVLRVEPAFVRLRNQVKAIAGLLEEKASIPMVREQLPLIQDLQTDEWWQDVTTPMLENVRKRIRALVKLIDKQKRKPIYTDFEDQIGGETTVELPGFNAPDTFERFRAKARAFLKEHQDHIAVQKLRMNEALTPTDLSELERMLVEAGIGTSNDLERAKQESNGLGVFIRSLVGLDREAAKKALGQFLSGKSPTANQIEFIGLIIDHLTERGVMDANRLYESPFTDINPQGPPQHERRSASLGASDP